MAHQFRRYLRLAGAVILPTGLAIMLALNLLGHGKVSLPEYPPIAVPGLGDLVVYYDTRMAPIRAALLPNQEVGCCVDAFPTRESMRAALQIEAARYALLPAKVGKAGESELLLLDFDTEDQLQEALPRINGKLIVHPGNGTGLVKLNPGLPPAPAAAQPAEARP